MRFIKRLLFVIFLLVMAFLVYRLVSPKAAKELLFDLKTFSNDKVWTHFSLSGQVIDSPSSAIETTGAVIAEDTWIFQEITGDEEELLLNDSPLPQDTGTSTPCPAMPTVKTCPTGQEKYVSYSSPDCWTYYSCRTKTTTTTTKTTTSSNGLSSKDKSDLNNLLKNFQ